MRIENDLPFTLLVDPVVLVAGGLIFSIDVDRHEASLFTVSKGLQKLYYYWPEQSKQNF